MLQHFTGIRSVHFRHITLAYFRLSQLFPLMNRNSHPQYTRLTSFQLHLRLSSLARPLQNSRHSDCRLHLRTKCSVLQLEPHGSYATPKFASTGATSHHRLHQSASCSLHVHNTFCRRSRRLQFERRNRRSTVPSQNRTPFKTSSQQFKIIFY